jgi:hypothetical protein
VSCGTTYIVSDPLGPFRNKWIVSALSLTACAIIYLQEYRRCRLYVKSSYALY